MPFGFRYAPVQFRFDSAIHTQLYQSYCRRTRSWAKVLFNVKLDLVTESYQLDVCASKTASARNKIVLLEQRSKGEHTIFQSIYVSAWGWKGLHVIPVWNRILVRCLTIWSETEDILCLLAWPQALDQTILRTFVKRSSVLPGPLVQPMLRA